MLANFKTKSSKAKSFKLISS